MSNLETCYEASAEKECTKCHEQLPATKEFFYRDRRSQDGLRTICKACYSELPSVLRRNHRMTP